MNNILLSIIVPYYDSRDSLNRLLLSIPEHEWLEVIVVNDHSDDVSDIIDKHERSSLHQQLNEKKWAGAARNKGLSLAVGKFILFADSDDFFIVNAFDIIYEYLVTDLDIVFFSPTSINSHAKKRSNRHLGYEILVKDFVSKGSDEILYKFHVPWSKLISKKLIVSNSIFFDEVIASNDVNFSLKVAYHATKVKADLRNIYCVVESENSLTKITSEAVLDSRFEALSRYNDFLKYKELGHKQSAMSGHLFNTRKFGFYKFLYRFFYCKYKGYPVFYGFKHVIKAFRHFKAKS
jgi:glycosyltransferase involved in cell wall biosynthesis